MLMSELTPSERPWSPEWLQTQDLKPQFEAGLQARQV